MPETICPDRGNGIVAANRYARERRSGVNRLKTRDALAFLSNGSNYQRPKGFELLNPVYDIDHHGIELYIQSIIRKEYQ